MPVYRFEGDVFDVPESDVKRFEAAMPGATVDLFDRDGNQFDVPVMGANEFRQKVHGWSYHNPVLKRQLDEQWAEEDRKKAEDPNYLPGIDGYDANAPKTSKVEYPKVQGDGIAPYGTPAQTAIGANVKETPAKALMNDSEGVEVSKVDMPKVDAPIKTDTVVKSPVFTEQELEENEQGALEVEKANLPKDIAELEEKLSKGGLAAQARLSLQSQLDKKKARFEEIYAEEFDANRKALREQTKHLREVVDKHVSDAHQQQGTWTTFPSTAGAFSVYTPTKKSVVAEQAQYNLDRVEELIANADRVAKGQTWVGGVGHGLADRATDLRTWQDLLNPTMPVEQEKVVTEAMEKADRGEKLTDAEDALLDSEALRIAAQEYFKSTWKDGYKIGEITGESLPFMVEMALNPVSKAGSTVKGLSLAVLKRYAKRFGTKEAVKQLTKRGGKRLAADIAGATAMSATTGAGGVMADAERRGRGQAQFDEDMRYIGHTEGEEHAVRNAFVARSIDNVTEMMPLFRGVTRTTQKVFKKVAPKPLREAIEGITGSEWAKHVDDFAQRTQWHGPIEEYFEEVEAGILNAALVGDQSLDEFFTVENQLETFLGVALMGATMSTVKTLGYESAKTRARKSAERLDSDMRNVMGASWDALEIDLRNPETAARVLADMRMDGSGYSQREIDAATRYAQLRAKQMGAEIGEAKLAETNPQAVAAHDSYDSGNAAVEVEQKADVEESFERADAAMREVFGENDMALLEGDNFIEVANQFVEHGADSELITNYINARSAREGMMDRLTEEIEAATANVDAEVDQVTNRETGNVQSVRMKDGSVAHVVSGEVVLREDGSVDSDNSSKNLVIFRDGKLEFSNPHMVEEASAPVNAESHKQERKSEIETTHLEATEAGIEEVRRGRAATEAVETNGRVMLRGNQEGEVVEAEVLPSDEPGMVYVRGAKSVFGANVVEIPMAEYTARYAGRVRDERSAEDAQGGVVAPDVSEGSDSVASDGTEGGASGVTEGSAGVEVGDVQGEGEAVNDTKASEDASVGASASALSRMPKTEQGEVDYAHADVNLASQAFLEEVEGDVESAIALATETAQEARGRAKALAETAPQTAGLSPSEKAKAVREHKAQVAQAEAEATQWEDIAEVLQQSQQVAEEAPTQENPSVQGDQVSDQVEVAPQAQNEVENVTSQDENATENVGDSKTQELTDEEEAKRREEFQQWVDSVTEVASRMAERWGKLLNVNVRVHTDVSTISNKEAVKRINKGDVVDGWYEPKTGEVHVYVPGVVTRGLMDGVHPTTRLEMTIRHEVVAHKGLREILGLEEYNAVMRSVWEGMNEAERKTWLAYVNGDANNVSDQIAAADEMCAHISELTEPSTREMTLFERLVQAIKDFFKKGEMTVLESEIRDLLKANYAYMREANEANKQAVLEQAERVKSEAKKSTNVEESSGEDIAENSAEQKDDATEATEELRAQGANVDEKRGDVRFSAAYTPKGEAKEKFISDVMEVTGRSRTDVESYLKAEESLTAFIYNEQNAPFLDYRADDRYTAIKENSDYPQGTVDFNNICRKRASFTTIYDRLQREFPMHVFTGNDLAKIREVMKKNGMEVACGLCYVEDRRQLMGEIAESFIEELKGGFKEYASKSPAKAKVAEKIKSQIGDDTYIPDIADLITLAGSTELHKSHPNLYEAFNIFNNARGQQSANLFQGYAEYKREILKWSDAKVKKANDNGGLRIFSYSDFEAHHLIDIVQIINDCAARGVKIQGYTKVPAVAKVLANTNVKLNRSLIPLGDTGIKDGKLAYDPIEGIDINDKDFFESNDNVGNVLVGCNDEQIRMAMADDFVHYIIPFHTNQKQELVEAKGCGKWTNYKYEQREYKDGKAAEKGVNIYTDVLNAAEKEGNPITNEREFTERFLAVCKERGLTPRFARFLNTDANGEYTYTPGYYKLLLDFKMFDANGNILPQNPIEANFDNQLNQEILADYVKGESAKLEEGHDAKMDKVFAEVKSALGLTPMFSAKERANMSPAEMLERMSEGQGDDIRFSFIGEKGAEALDRAEEATTRLDNLAVAREMETQGKDALAIKMATGWERGADNKWRYETEDVKLKKDFWKKKDVTLGDVADLGELGKAYPDLKDIKVVFDTNESERRGTYSHKNNSITLYIMDANNTRKMAGAISRNIPFTKFIADYMTSSAKESVDKTLVHEIQHAIQSREGFAKGGNKRMRIGESEERLGYEGYRKLAGEVEARNVSERMGKSMEERRASLRTETQDVADEDQIFIYDALESASSEENVDAVNARFNEELDGYINGRSKANMIFHVGNPMGVMQHFLPNLPIVMRPRVINKATNTKHDVSVEALHDLPKHISAPIFVFQRDDNALGVLTEIKDNNGKNVCVAIELNKTIQDGGTYLEVNDIRSIHGRDIENLILPIIHNNTLKYVDKEKGLDWLSSASSNYQQEITKQDLVSATKVVENFENPQILGQENDGDTLYSYKPFGGNRGYVGYSMSKRAAQAREEGRFPKTDFKKEYGVTEKVLDALVKAGIVDNAEWHHTSMYGNKTPFYGWVDDAYADVYAENKKTVKQILEGKNADGTPFAELPTENLYTEMRVPLPEGWYPFLNNLDDNLTEAEREVALMERFGDAYAKLKEASENNRLYHEYEANKGRMEREYYAKVGEKLKEFFEEKVATASQLTGTDSAATMSQRSGRTMFSFAKTPEEFDAIRDEAHKNKGIVSPNLGNTSIEIVDVKPHDFKGNLEEAREQAKKWAEGNLVYEENGKETRKYSMPNNGGTYEISKKAVKKYADFSAINKSENAFVHLSALKKLPEIISNSVEAEIHADYDKNEDGVRVWSEKIGNKNLLVHRLYGAINFDGNVYRVKTTMYEYRDALTKNTPHSYEVTKIELIEDSSVTPNDGIDRPLNRSTNSITAAKLLENVEKTYDSGVKLIDASEKTPTMFSSVPGSLVAMHNLTASNLDHVVKMGGIANPSMAVVNSDISVLDNFGEITLIAPRELIEKKTGKNAGTWAADAYSPRYPNVEYVIPYKEQRELEQRAVDAGVNKYEASAFVQRIEDSGKKWLDGDKTARALFAKEGREGESFDDYIDRLMNEVVQKEQIFMGYTDNGRRYANHTLANVSRIMKKEGRAGAEGHFGVGSIRAQLTPIFKTIAQIQKNKDRLVSAEEWKEAVESINKRYHDLGDEIGHNELGEALLERDPKGFLEREYDIEITNEEEAQIKQLAADLAVMPTEYFETKFERPVMLNEFVGAIIPENASARTRKILDDAGIPYNTYNQEVEGDRKQVVQNYTKELDKEVGNVRFSYRSADKMNRLRGVLGTMGIRVNEVESENGRPYVVWSFLDDCLEVAKPEDIDEGVFFAGVANAIAFGKDIDTALGKENVDAFVDDVIADVFADFEGDADFDSALRDAGFDMRKAVRHYLSKMSVESYRAGGGFITYLENRLTEALRAKYGAGTFDGYFAFSTLHYLEREGEPDSGLIDVMSRIASRWETERERRGGEGSDSVASDRTDGSGSDGGGTSGDDHKITRGKAKRVLRESREERTARVMYEEQVEILGCEFHLHGVCKAIWDALKSKKGERLSTLKRNFKRLGNEWVEVAQDRTNAIRALQRAIEKAGGEALSSMEDVWSTLGALSSKNYAEIQDVHRRLVAPLIDVFAAIRKKTGLDHDQIERYLYCKHALERNALMGTRAYEEAMKKGYERVKALHPEDASSLTEREFKMRYAEELAEVEKQAKKLLNKDYSGVKELLFGEKMVSHAKVTETAEQVVREFEKLVGTADVTQLWASIKALTDFSLKKEYDCGLISKELYNEVREMYANYVPLRGWENDYAGDIFAYNKDGDVTDGIQRAYKKANGRKSQAKDILGHTIAMAHSAIACGNKNKAKQKFLFLAENHPSDLLLTSDMWYQIGADGKIEAVTADIHEDMSPEEVAEEIADFEARMKEAEKAGLAKRYKNDFGKELGLHMKPFQEKQHGVRVMVNGREHMVWVVGNPRAAMVLNGSLNDTLKHGWWRKFYSRLMRFQNSSNTSWNFNFVMGNVQRDFQTALNSGLINKGAAYAKKFTANYAKIMGSAAGAFIGGGVGSVVGGGVGTAVGTIVGGGAGAVINTAMGEGVLPIVGLMYRYNEGKLDMEDPMDRAFYEFAMNGGITGITSMLAAEEAQESFESEVDKKVHGGVVSGTKEVVGGLFNNIELLNNAFENATRFATFLTSREMGSSMTEAVMDAKEHSVNFNMRGTGAWSDVGWMIHTISFANAALQALRLNREWFANDWKKTTGVFLSYVAMGMTNAILMSLVFDGDDDDDEPNEDWYGLSRFNRYNNFNVLAGDGSVKVSIPHEFRAPFAIGNMMVDVYNGKISQRDAIAEIVAMPWNYSPVALVGPGTDITDLNDVAFTAVGEMLPTVFVKDVYDLWRNENYLGARIHNMSDYNEDVPEFQRTTKRTRSFYVAFSRGVNELLGGAYNRRSPVEWAGNNPGVVQYLVEQRIGGGVVAWANAFGAISDAVDDEAEVDVYDIPFVKTIWAKGGKDNVFQTMVWNEFEGFQDSYIAIDSELRRNAKNTELTLEYKLQRIATMEQNGELDSYFKFKGYNAIDNEYQRRIKAAQKDGDDDEVKRLREEQFDYRKHALSQIKDAVSTDTELLIRAEKVRAEVQPFIERMSDLKQALNKEDAREEKDSEKIAALEAELDAISDPEILKKIGAYEDYLYYQREYESELKLGNAEAAEDARKDMLDAARLME